MSRLYSIGYEQNSATTNLEGDTYSLVTVSTTNVRSGTYALRANAVANAPFWRTQVLSADSTTAIVYFRFYLYIASTPTANTQISRIVNASNVQQSIIQLTTTNTLQLRNGSTTQIGSDSSALSTNTWYRVEYSWNPATGATAAYLDGVSFASGTGTTGSWSRVLLGCITGNPTADLYFDDVAINDDSGSVQNTYPGNGKIIYLRPSAAGDATTWTPNTGANWAAVDEIPPNDDTDYVRNSITLNDADMYNVTNSGLASGDTINLVSVGFRGRGETSTSNQYQFTVRAEKTSGGTISESASLNLASTTYVTNAAVAPRNYPLTLYLDPDSAAWTNTTLDSMQIGVKTSVTSTNRVRVTSLWALVDYTPGVGGSTGQMKAYNGSAFIAKPVKVWNGSAWVVKPLKRWNGSSWVTTPY